MTSKPTTRDSITSALRNFIDGDLLDAATELLRVLGYESDRTLELSGDALEFINEISETDPSTRRVTQSETRFREEVESVKIIHQVTDDEINRSASAQGFLMDDAASFDKGHNKSFIFAAVELKRGEYSRGQYAEFTREVNKLFQSPCVVIFNTPENLVTIAFVNRREHKRDEKRDVLGNVSLIRHIEVADPHRAHRDIIEELSLDNMLEWMDQHKRVQNFDGLLAAWLYTLDTQELNKRFYRELFRWFERAVDESKFPTKQAKVIPAEEHVVRLITRLMFVWFIKEKRLIADQLFNESQIEVMLRNYDRETGDSYYRAVLQNLFFGTLNTEIKDRRFSTKTRDDHREPSLYRYRDEIAEERSLMDLFSNTPFVNGGLFDCLDDFRATSAGGYRIDCFSDNMPHRNLLSIPNRLFFDENGIITLFGKYKFTIEENTPAEREVALDPELLGSVFENLLAAIVPETKIAARKQTGSYYTPRPVVDYMVDEALVASLSDKVQPADGDIDFLQDRIRYLLDYNGAFNDGGELFESDEISQVVEAIANLKVLDPAVGSGAFPMGILHKLTLALKRLDPANREWERLQKQIAVGRTERAFGVLDQRDRDDELTAISATFERYRDSDFGRKLYLIQNSIFGVDIQPIACQIARLRFFISLAIEQVRSDDPNDNYGFKPLPNLETRFVAADTLIGLDNASQGTLSQTPVIVDVQTEINDNREKYFHANHRQHKLDCIKQDSRLRKRLATELKKVGMPAGDAERIASLDLYDQNATADWFDPRYMFGVGFGFAVVLGNPPYIALQKDEGKLADRYEKEGFGTFARKGDIYQLFYEKGREMLTQRGILSYITSNSWLKSDYGVSTRDYISKRSTPLRLIEMGEAIFANAIVDTAVLILRNGRTHENAQAVDMDHLVGERFPPGDDTWGDFPSVGPQPWSILSPLEQSVMTKFDNIGVPLNVWDVNFNMGIKTGFNKAFVIDSAIRQQLIEADPNSSDIIKPMLRGEDVHRFRTKWAGKWLISTHNGYDGIPPVDITKYPAVKKYLDLYFDNLQRRQDQGVTPYNLRSCKYYGLFAQEKLFWMDMAGTGRFAHSEDDVYSNNAAFILTHGPLKYLCAILNSTLVSWFMKHTARTTGKGLTIWHITYVARIPIPQLSAAKQRPFVRLVDRILQAKDANPDADTSDLEAEIDQLVYQLYGLTDDEIAAVEGR